MRSWFIQLQRLGMICCAAVVAACLASGSGHAQMGTGGGEAAPGAYGAPASGPYAAPPSAPGAYGAPAAPAPGTYGAPVAPAPGAYGAPVAPAPGAYGAPAAPAPGAYGAPAAPAPGAYGAPAAPPAPSAYSAPSAPGPISPGVVVAGSATPATPIPLPNGINVTNLSGAASQLTPQQINAAMQALGISPDEALALQQQIATGVISPSQIQSLCAHLAASNVNPAMLQSIAGTIGLNATQLQQLQGCMPGGAAQAPTPPPTNAPPVQISGGPMSAQGGSLIEHNYQALDLQLPPPYPTPTSLSQFGYSVFASTVSSFAPVTNIPVGPDYVVGPGDQLYIYTWGRMNQSLSATVNRDGSIVVSGIEPLQVGGLTFSEAKKLIEGRMQQISGLNVHVTMGQLRTIQVLVVGAVSQPGTYTISPLSRVSNALIAAGGVAKIGSLRKVQLRRGNHTIKQIDYYNLLLRGDNSDDEYLQNNDIVFVPPIGPVVGVIGDVERPAIYELKGRESLRQALRLAAGAGPFSNTERVQVLRADVQRRLIALDVDYKDNAVSFRLHDGDLVKVFHMQTIHEDTVVLTGNVRRPGEYQWHPGMTVSELIRMGDGVNFHTYFKYARVQRLIYPSLRRKIVPVNLEAALRGTRANADLMLQPLDQLDIFNEDNLREAPVVSITGEVLAPGTYALSPNTRLSDVIYMAGGFKENADRAKIELVRTKVAGGQAHFVRMDVDYRPGRSGKPKSNPLIDTKDQIYVSVASGWHPPWTVTVSGEVMRPGTYPIGRDDRLASLIVECGGFTPNAFPDGIVFTRASVQAVEQQRLNQSVQQMTQGLAQLTLSTQTGNQGPGQQNASAGAIIGLQSLLAQAQTQQATGRMVVQMEDLPQLQASSNNVLLVDGDKIAIPPKPASVSVLGSVNQPGSITAQTGWTVQDYLYRAGGPSPFSDTKLITVIKADGSAITQQSIDKEHSFPFYSVVSGGLMGMHLQAGDTIYVPPDVETFIKTQYWLDITSIISNTAQGLAIVALLAKNL